MKFLPKISECEFNCLNILESHSTAFYFNYEFQKGLSTKKKLILQLSTYKNNLIDLLLMELGDTVKMRGKDIAFNLSTMNYYTVLI